jgi:hypothetical protein
VIVFNAIRLLGVFDHPSSSAPTVDYAESQPRHDVPAVPADSPENSGTLLEPAQRQLMGWGLLQQSLSRGDCQTIRELWRPYMVLVARAHSDEKVEASRKHQILEMCPELQEFLEEPL